MLRRVARVLWKVVKAGALLVVLVVVLSLGTLWLEHNSALELPSPTGRYAVGRLVTTWTDPARDDPFAPGPKKPRELLVWIWYPAGESQGATRADYVPRFWRDARDPQASWLLTTFLWRNPTRIRAHSLERAEVASDHPRYPLVVFRSGIGATSMDYTTVLEDLASHGFIVVSADAPHSTWSVVMPDGRVIHKTDPGNPDDAPVSEAERTRMLEALLGV